MLSAETHGYLDYATVVLFLISPLIFPLSITGCYLAYILAGVHLLMTLFTTFPASIVNAIPFSFHGYVELLVGIVLISGTWLLDDLFSHADQLFYTVIGLLILIIWGLTNYRVHTPDESF